MKSVFLFKNKVWVILIGYAAFCAAAAGVGGMLEKIFLLGRFFDDGTDAMPAVFLLRAMTVFMMGFPFVVLWNWRGSQQEKLAVTDDVTGLYNHRQLLAVLNHEFVCAKRYARPLSVLMMDLDQFKSINDRHGHLTGDAVLRSVGQILKTNTREADICGRYGGDEFFVILPHTGEKDAQMLAWRLWNRIYHHPFLENETPIQVSVSVGIASTDSNLQFSNANELIHEADLAMFKAKVRKEARLPEKKKAPVPVTQTQHSGFEYLLYNEHNENSFSDTRGGSYEK